MSDQRWIGGINTGPACTGCGADPDRGSAWSFSCSIHGGACGDCKVRTGRIACPHPEHNKEGDQ